MWYCQIMALCRCSIGDYAVIRYCDVTKSSEQMEKDGKICRPCIVFERETNRQGNLVIKYDVVEIDTLLPSFEKTEMKRPPYMVPMFRASGRGLDVMMLDAQFF